MSMPVLDREIHTLRSVYRAMKEFDYATKARMLQWLQQRFDSDEKYRDQLSRVAARADSSPETGEGSR